MSAPPLDMTVLGESAWWRVSAALAAAPLFWASLLGALGMWLMLPGGGRRMRVLGAAAALAALGLFVAQSPVFADWARSGAFWIIAGVTLAAAAATVTMRSPVYSAVWFALSLLGAASLFLLVGAQLLAVATIIIYAGAIVVTILFVLMLAQPQGREVYDRIGWGAFPALLSALAAAAMVGLLSLTVASLPAGLQPSVAAALEEIKDREGMPRVPPAALRHARLAPDRNGTPTLWLTLRETAWETLPPGRTAPLTDAERHALQEELHRRGAVALSAEEYEVQLLRDDLLAREHVARIGRQLFGRHLVAVQVVGVLLLVALVGAAAIVTPAAARAGGDGPGAGAAPSGGQAATPPPRRDR